MSILVFELILKFKCGTNYMGSRPRYMVFGLSYIGEG